MSSGMRQNGLRYNMCCQATFLCLLKGEEYSLTIKTLLNGFPVGQVTEKFNTGKLGSLLKKELTEDEDDKKEVEEEAPAGAQEEKDEDVEEEDDPNRLQKQEMEGNEEGEMKSENQERKKSENTEQEVQIAIFQSFDIAHTEYIEYEIKIYFND